MAILQLGDARFSLSPSACSIAASTPQFDAAKSLCKLLMAAGVREALAAAAGPSICATCAFSACCTNVSGACNSVCREASMPVAAAEEEEEAAAAAELMSFGDVRKRGRAGVWRGEPSVDESRAVDECEAAGASGSRLCADWLCAALLCSALRSRVHSFGLTVPALRACVASRLWLRDSSGAKPAAP